MLQMVNGINTRVGEILNEPATELLAVTCATCYRNQWHRMMLKQLDESGE